MPIRTNAKSKATNGARAKNKIEKSPTKALRKPPVQSHSRGGSPAYASSNSRQSNDGSRRRLDHGYLCDIRLDTPSHNDTRRNTCHKYHNRNRSIYCNHRS